MIIFYNIAATGLNAYEAVMEVTTNNIANAQTVGYKRRRAELENIFPTYLSDALAEIEEEAYDRQGRWKRTYEIGTGVKIVDVVRDERQGTIDVTDHMYDMAITGRGFFRFQKASGEFAYGRAGNLHVNAEGYMVDTHGNRLDPPIRIPRNATEVFIDSAGHVFVAEDDDEQQRRVGQVMLATFRNENGLRPIGENLWVPTFASGEAVMSQPLRNMVGGIQQFALEVSNVNIVEEMMRMVMTQRAFEVTAKSAQAGDAILKSGM